MAAEDYAGTSSVTYGATAGPLPRLLPRRPHGERQDVRRLRRRRPGSPRPPITSACWLLRRRRVVHGRDLLTREPGQPGGTGAATLANNEMLELQAFLNEGGKLLYTGRSAGWPRQRLRLQPGDHPAVLRQRRPDGRRRVPAAVGRLPAVLAGCPAVHRGRRHQRGHGRAVRHVGNRRRAVRGTAWTLNGGTAQTTTTPTTPGARRSRLLTTSSLHPPGATRSSRAIRWRRGTRASPGPLTRARVITTSIQAGPTSA